MVEKKVRRNIVEEEVDVSRLALSLEESRYAIKVIEKDLGAREILSVRERVYLKLSQERQKKFFE